MLSLENFVQFWDNALNNRREYEQVYQRECSCYKTVTCFPIANNYHYLPHSWRDSARTHYSVSVQPDVPHHLPGIGTCQW